MQENAIFRIGDVQSPLPETGAHDLPLSDLDPVLDAIIQFFPFVINLHCRERWNAEVIKCGLEKFVNRVVAQAIPYDPLPLAQTDLWKFPLFAAYPVSSTYQTITTGNYVVEREIELVYILPPLQSSQAERILPFLTHIERIIAQRLHDGYEATFAPESVWATSGVSRIDLQSSSYGKIPRLETNAFYPALSISIKATERNEFVRDNYQEFEGVDASIDVASDPEPLWQNAVETITNF